MEPRKQARRNEIYVAYFCVPGPQSSEFEVPSSKKNSLSMSTSYLTTVMKVLYGQSRDCLEQMFAPEKHIHVAATITRQGAGTS